MSKLPEVTSWIHPLYAVWNAGAHLDNLKPGVYKTLICRLSDEDMQRVQYALRICISGKGYLFPSASSQTTSTSKGNLFMTGRRTDTADTCDEGHPEDTNYNNTGYSSHIKRTQTSSTRGKSKAAPSTTASKDMKNTTSKPAPDRSRRGQRAERGSSRRGRSGQRSDLEAGPSSTRRASVAESEQSAAKSTASKPRAKSGTA